MYACCRFSSCVYEPASVRGGRGQVVHVRHLHVAVSRRANEGEKLVTRSSGRQQRSSGYRSVSLCCWRLVLRDAVVVNCIAASDDLLPRPADKVPNARIGLADSQSAAAGTASALVVPTRTIVRATQPTIP